MKFQVYALEEDSQKEEVFGEVELDAFPPQNTIITLRTATEAIEAFVVGTTMRMSSLLSTTRLRVFEYRLFISILTRKRT